jgi:acetolactate decarboxylase
LTGDGTGTDRQAGGATPEHERTHGAVRTLHLKLPHATWAALEARRRATGESVHHIVRAALAAHLEVEHQTLYQVSMSNALVEGVYGGAVTVGQLREHGDFGLGTFEGLDGEMVVCDGEVYQVRSDGSVRVAANADATPFAAVLHFQPDATFGVAGCRDLASLLARIDSARASSNVFYAIRVDGAFDLVHTRALCRTAEGVPLVVAAAHQPEFRIHDVHGTMVGSGHRPTSRRSRCRAITCTSSPPRATPAGTSSAAPAATSPCAFSRSATCASRCRRAPRSSPPT